MKAAVIGNPVSHSLSPIIFKFLSRNLGQKIQYSAIEVLKEDCRNFIKKAQLSGDYLGLNVTLPLKEVAVKDVDVLTSEASAIGAVNVIHFQHNKSKGFNTDIIGIEKTLQRQQFNPSGLNCFIWGAGGSARTMAFVLGKLGAKKVIFFNRSEKGSNLIQDLAEQFPKTIFQFVTELSEVKKTNLSLMINTTPVGMSSHEGSGNAYFAQARELTFSPHALAFDFIYTPESTEFLEISASLGLRIVSGLGMLIDQALATWKIWFGPLERENDLHEELKLILRGVLRLRVEPSPLFLTGHSGVGKTTVASELAHICQRAFIDTDAAIEEATGSTINDIFKNEGEELFRLLEEKTLMMATEKKFSVVSLGGGSLLKRTSFDHVISKGVLIYLEADKGTIFSRLKDGTLKRPLLQNLDEEKLFQKISSLMEERKAIYEMSHLMVQTSGLDTLEVCFRILSMLGEKP